MPLHKSALALHMLLVSFSTLEVGLEAENRELQALVKEWRMWYAQCPLAFRVPRQGLGGAVLLGNNGVGGRRQYNPPAAVVG